MITVAVTAEDFDVAALHAQLGRHGGGAIASFVGLVRGTGGIEALELEHYPAMTEPALKNICEQAWNRWPLLAVSVVHRVGKLSAGAQIVFVGTVSAHRQAAFDSCNFIMDFLKTEAPFWKREFLSDGTSRWVEARAEDDSARDNWQHSPR